MSSCSSTSSTATVLLLGPTLFLAGHLLFQRTVAGAWVRSRLAGLAVLLLLVPVALVPGVGVGVAERITLSFLTTVTVVGVAASDSLGRRRRDPERTPPS
ncbi:MAG: hypothetical protein ACRDN0_40275 [Trebonia sp.]